MGISYNIRRIFLSTIIDKSIFLITQLMSFELLYKKTPGDSVIDSTHFGN